MSKELSLNKEKLKEKELTYKEKMTEKDLRYQEYEAIQADEEIPVGERVHREKEAVIQFLPTRLFQRKLPTKRSQRTTTKIQHTSSILAANVLQVWTEAST